MFRKMEGAEGMEVKEGMEGKEGMGMDSMEKMQTNTSSINYSSHKS